MVVAIIVCVFLFIFSAMAFYIACLEKKEQRELEKETKELKESAKQQLQAMQKANETKANARTGNNTNDLDYMANKLQKFANKNK